MAVLKFTNSKGSLKKILDYVMQPKKTETALVSGQHCMPETAFEEMTATRNIYNKPGGRQYIHLVQSFAPFDKLTHRKAHEIGRHLAARFSGFQCVIATHKDRQHIHNHIVICSVNMETGLKFQQSKQDMQAVKDYSDKLCREAGLSVIRPERKGKYRKMAEYQLEKKGSITWRSILKNDIDEVLKTTFSFNTFLEDMQRKGYTVKQGKQFSFKPPGGERFVRLRSLGKGYTEAAIRKKLEGSIMATLQRAQAAKRGPAQRDFVFPDNAPQEYVGLQADYWQMLYLLDKVKTGQVPNHLAVALKAELVNMDRYTRQLQLLVRHNVQDIKGLDALISAPETSRTDLKIMREIQRDGPRITQKLMEVDALHTQRLERQNQSRNAPKHNRDLGSLR